MLLFGLASHFAQIASLNFPHGENLLVQCSPLPHVHFSGNLLVLALRFGFGYRPVKFPTHASIIQTSKRRCHKNRVVRDRLP